jgi:HTH-type transcriptional regulator/antitoxin HipB
VEYPIQTPAQLATHLRALRKANHLTQAQLGKLVGLHQSRIAKIERDPSLVGMRQVLKLLSALGVQVILQSGQTSRSRGSRSTAQW